ncbi:unnamed protein product [Bacteroides ovatus V975]|uniref:Uncharacterized protein n=1 Tax=Bacteroides ovatus (strain ATCC 8483 / DSM 1896 / JCM 5824 / BCRC 10623 / CCUG 4943 / NCTC 11153) TaxID=411476 RepID=A0AAN3A5R9_BACO1|nr:hypothetical protein BACOVA_04007 [Bacteroides ovatus ATCC 8483]SCV09488.1 unnamed protein product [Bacteroides ovatus V975]
MFLRKEVHSPFLLMKQRYDNTLTTCRIAPDYTGLCRIKTDYTELYKLYRNMWKYVGICKIIP